MSNNLKPILKNIADAIRDRKGTSEPIKASDFASEIASIKNGEYNIDVTESNGIQKLNITLAGISKELTVNLPEEFATATEIYHFQVNDDTILFSSQTQDIGLWVYNINENSWKQGYSTGYSWRYFQKINDNKCLISSSYFDGVLLYISDDNITLAYSSGKSYEFFHQVNIDKWLISSSNTHGILLFNAIDNTINKIYDIGYRLEFFKLIGDKALLGSSSVKGIWLYNDNDNTATRLYEYGYWRYFQSVGNKCLIASNTSNSSGLLLLDFTNNEITKIYENGYNWRYFYIVKDRCLISTSNGSDNGILLFDSNNDTITRIGDGYGYKYFHSITDAKVLMTSANNTMLLLYNYENNSIVSKGVRTIYCDVFKQDGIHCYISASNKSKNAFTYYYDSTDDSVKLVGYYIGEV